MEKTQNHLQKALGVGFGIAIMVGGTIGVGIFRTPGIIAGMLDNYWMIIACWLFGGVYVLIGAGTFAELATMLPKEGGAFNYVKRAFGIYAGFITGWFDYITNAIAPAFFCIVISEYIAVLIPALEKQTLIIAISFLVGFTTLHATGVKNASMVQQISSVVKVLFFVALIIMCFAYSGVQINPIKKSATVINLSLIISFFKSLQLILGTYDGWTSGSYFTEEDENPNKNIPKSLYSGAVILIVIYTIINMAFLYVLPASSLAKTPIAASGVANVIFGERGGMIVTIIAIVSIISILNALMMIPSRIMFGLSNEGYFIKAGNRVNKAGTPIVSLLISAVFTLVLICVGTFEILFSLSTFMSVIVWALVYVALIKLRISEPDLARPHKSWGYPYTSILMILFSIALFIGFAYSDSKSLLTIGVIILISYPVFLLIKSRDAIED